MVSDTRLPDAETFAGMCGSINAAQRYPRDGRKGYGPSGSCIQAGMSRWACSTRQTSRWSSRST
jgi:hypothetical protein